MTKGMLGMTRGMLGMSSLVILRRPQADVRIYRLGWWARTAACQVEESMWV